MDNPTFVDEENIPLVQDEDYNDYRTLDASRIDAGTFTEPATTEATSTLHLRQKRKQDKIVSLWRYLDVTGDPSIRSIYDFKKFKNR